MPSGNLMKFEKEVSSKISLQNFEHLKRYAKELYNQNVINQPTISALVRHILSEWITNKGNEDGTIFSPFQGGPNFLEKVPEDKGQTLYQLTKL
jgi:hypothetical protein